MTIYTFDDPRAEFEAWAKSDTAGITFERDAMGHYNDFTAALLWHAWEACWAASQKQTEYVPWPKKEDITDVMRAAFERRRTSRGALEKMPGGTYRSLRTESD